MTERPLYALCPRAFTARLAVVLLALDPGTVTAQSPPSGRAPCAACIVLTIAAGQSVLIAGPLEGLEIVVRTEGASLDAVRAAIDAVRRAGGRAGLWVPGVPGA